MAAARKTTAKTAAGMPAESLKGSAELPNQGATPARKRLIVVRGPLDSIQKLPPGLAQETPGISLEHGPDEREHAYKNEFVPFLAARRFYEVKKQEEADVDQSEIVRECKEHHQNIAEVLLRGGVCELAHPEESYRCRK